MEKSEETPVVICCDHQHPSHSKDPLNCKELSIFVRYEEYERIIKCGEEHDNNQTPSSSSSSSSNNYNETKKQCLGDVNPVDCEECKKMLSDFLTSHVLHPNPNQVIQDMFDKVSGLRRRLAANSEVLSHYTVYQIVNNVERHCMSRDRHWSVTWVDYQQQPPNHPRPPRVMEMVKGEGEGEGEGFTCAICLEGVDTNKGTKRKRSTDTDDDDEDNGSGLGTKTRVVRLLSCKHMFHKSCIDRWLKEGGRDTCPLCRFQLPKTLKCRFHWDDVKKKALDNSKGNKTDFDKLHV